MSQNNIFELKIQYLEYLEIEKGRSLKTVKNYDRYISLFLNFSKIKNPSEISLEKIRQFRINLNRTENGKKGLEKKTLNKNTQNYYLIALRSFLKYLSKNDIETLAPEKIELAKTSMRELDLISRSDFKKLMTPEKITDKNKEEILKEQAILELLYSTGLRVSELCALNSDCNIDAEEMSIRGKGEKIRIVFISEKARSSVKKYLNLREEKFRNGESKTLSEGLFLTKAGNRIHPRAVQRILKKRSKQAGISKNVTPHTIRHYFATDLLQNGADIRSVQMLLGHASINTTQVYTNPSDKFLKDVHKKFHGGE
jgi:site-specific recombinase XerD